MMLRYVIFGSDTFTKTTGMLRYSNKKYRYAPILSQKMPVWFDTLTKSTGLIVSRYKSINVKITGMNSFLTSHLGGKVRLIHYYFAKLNLGFFLQFVECSANYGSIFHWVLISQHRWGSRSASSWPLLRPVIEVTCIETERLYRREKYSSFYIEEELRVYIENKILFGFKHTWIICVKDMIKNVVYLCIHWKRSIN